MDMPKPLVVPEKSALVQFRQLLAVVDHAVSLALSDGKLAVGPRQSSTPSPAATSADQPARCATYTRGSRVRYVAEDRRVRVPNVPARDQQVYRTLQRAPEGLTRAKLLSACHAQVHTGIVDGAVRRLRQKKLIRVESVVD